MQKSPLIVLFGKSGSQKEQIFEILTQQKDEKDFWPSPIKLEAIEEIHLLYTPNVDFFSENLKNTLYSLSEFATQFEFKIIQFVIFFKGCDENENINSIYDEIKQFILNPNPIQFTFVSKNIHKLRQEKKFCFNFLDDLQNNNLCTWLKNLKLDEPMIFKHIISDNDINNFKQEQEINADTLIKIWETLFTSFKKWKELFQSIQIENVNLVIQQFLEKINQKHGQQNLYLLLIIFMQLIKEKQLTQNLKIMQDNQNFWCPECQRFYSQQENKIFFFDKKIFLEQQKYIRDPCKKQYNLSIPTIIYNNNEKSFQKFIEKTVLNKTRIYFQGILSAKDQLYSKRQKNLNANETQLRDKGQFQRCESKLQLQSLKPSFSSDQVNNQKQSLKSQTKTRKPLTAILLSNENYQQQKFFKKITKIQTKKDEFTKSPLLKNQFYLVDAPYFSFCEQSEATIEKFSDYFHSNEIHFIFFFLEYQRLDIMKDRLNKMEKKLSLADHRKMALIIINLEGLILQEDIQSIQRIAENRQIKKVIFINNIDDEKRQQKLLEEICGCLEFVDETPFSFLNTVFEKQSEQYFHQEIEQFSRSCIQQTINDGTKILKKFTDEKQKPILQNQNDTSFRSKREFIYIKKQFQKEKTQQNQEQVREKKQVARNEGS